jgi:hypothetical protein
MTSICNVVPRFRPKQRVRFVGGEGVVRNYNSGIRGVMYLIEMALGPEPSFGRIGPETTIILNEADLRAA